jgi:hypothetical protein
MEDIDLSAWMRKPIVKPESTAARAGEIPTQHSVLKHDWMSVTDSNGSRSADDTVRSGGNIAQRARRQETTSEDSVSDEDGSVAKSIPRPQQQLYIDIPKLSEEEKEEYEYLPGHFSVQRIVSKLRGARYAIKLKSGESDIVSAIYPPTSSSLLLTSESSFQLVIYL